MSIDCDTVADFYLASLDYLDFRIPRKCWRISPVRTEERSDLLLIRTEPPVPHRELSYDKVVVSARHVGRSVLSITEWPVYVNVALIGADDVETTGLVKKQDMEVIAWAELYPTEEEALDSLRPPDPSAYASIDYSVEEPGMPEVTFLHEQDGDAEQELKTRLTSILAEAGSVGRAYLAMVAFSKPESTYLTLCLQMRAGPGPRLLDALNHVVSERYESGRPLATLMLTGKQERELAKVCRPFFVATPLPEPGRE